MYVVTYMLETVDKNRTTSIRVKRSTADLIDSLGKRGETLEDILLRYLPSNNSKKKEKEGGRI